ncbi:MAG TPA: hypothetical protein P5121_34810 [Caldilineaceae bacterium]|nr:hypothetical protein [Caldilineaceae bacterium]
MTKGNPERKRANQNAKQSQWRHIFALVLTGISIGWLSGLSMSPVISVVIGSVTTLVATIIAALSGVKEEFWDKDTSPNTVKRWLRAVTPVPLAWLVGGLLIGAHVGLFIRTHDLLSPSPADLLTQEVTKWETFGIPRDEVVAQLFAHSLTQPSGAVAQPVNSQRSVLNSVTEAACMDLIERANNDTEQAFRRYLSVKEPWQTLEIAVPDTQALREVIQALCEYGN